MKKQLLILSIVFCTVNVSFAQWERKVITFNSIDTIAVIDSNFNIQKSNQNVFEKRINTYDFETNTIDTINQKNGIIDQSIYQRKKRFEIESH